MEQRPFFKPGAEPAAELQQHQGEKGQKQRGSLEEAGGIRSKCGRVVGFEHLEMGGDEGDSRQRAV